MFFFGFDPRILDAVFVFGVEALNIPALGVEGAAWSTVASIWISCLSFCVLLSQRGFVDWTAALGWPLALKDGLGKAFGSPKKSTRPQSFIFFCDKYDK